MRVRPLVVVIVVVALAVIAWARLGALAGSEPPRESLTRTFRPPYPATIPDGRLVTIRSTTLSDDRQTLTVDFFGGEGYLRSDPCSDEFVPWVAAHVDVLDVAIVQVVPSDQATTAPGIACPDGAVQHTYQLVLQAPFAGATINDKSGQIFEARPAPAGS
jgi:hypothetical protein